jgi:SAM-dependent methyltransferase
LTSTWDVFRARHAVGCEISPSSIRALWSKYEGRQTVDIVEADVSSPDFDVGNEFDIVSAIGVMFEIVDDRLWENAVANIGRHLSEDGVAVIGGQFGYATRNVQFHNCADFDSWDQAAAARGEVALVNSRIRALRRWKSCGARAGLRVDCVKRARGRREIRPDRNLDYQSFQP